MTKFDSLSKLCDDVLLRRLTEVVIRDRATTAEMIALIAEVDERKLYLPAAYPSMFAYCVQELRLSQDSAYRRITAARAARAYPAIVDALAEGRLHLTAVGVLAPYMTPGNADELLRAAEHKTKLELDQFIAERFPRSELLALVETLPASSGRGEELVPERVGTHAWLDRELVPERVEAVVPRSSLVPHAPQRFALHLTISQGTNDKLRRAQELLSHQIPSGDVAEVIDRALDALIAKQESTKLAATSRPQRKRRPTTSARHIPAHVKRAVSERDGGQCTFISESGRRCASRTFLEFDHIDEVSRGGEATVSNLRLRCRAHNQYTAECTFGREFMNRKRQEGRRVSAEARSATAAATVPEPAECVVARQNPTEDRNVEPWLRRLGFNVTEARRVSDLCAHIPDAPLELRLRMALRGLAPRARTVPAPSVGAPSA